MDPLCQFERVAGTDRMICRQCQANRAFRESYRRNCPAFGRAPIAAAADSGPRGLGDVVAGVLEWLGLEKRPGCGCRGRQDALNRLVPFR